MVFFQFGFRFIELEIHMWDLLCIGFCYDFSSSLEYKYVHVNLTIIFTSSCSRGTPWLHVRINSLILHIWFGCWSRTKSKWEINQHWSWGIAEVLDIQIFQTMFMLLNFIYCVIFFLIFEVLIFVSLFTATSNTFWWHTATSNMSKTSGFQY